MFGSSITLAPVAYSATGSAPEVVLPNSKLANHGKIRFVASIKLFRDSGPRPRTTAFGPPRSTSAFISAYFSQTDDSYLYWFPS